MQAQDFQQWCDFISGQLQASEDYTLNLEAEWSDFIRFNHGKVRQAGQVRQALLGLTLIHEGRQADLKVTLSEDRLLDEQRLRAGIAQLRQTLPLLPVDPYLEINRAQWKSHSVQDGRLPPAPALVQEICQQAEGTDWVGIYAGGSMMRGFANSAGARGWHEAQSFNLDWSLFHENGQAVKSNYAGSHWDSDAFATKQRQAAEQLNWLGRPAKALEPGQYRAYLAPAAMDEIIGMLQWGGFSAQAIASKRSALQRLYSGDATLSPLVSLEERITDSLSPAFGNQGYLRQDLVLVQHGRGANTLVSSRSALEYGLEANGADNSESPSALSMAPGTLCQQDVLAALGTGLYISNLWYLNYSDLPAARMTGMTRFATFWVENGQIVAPVDTMRFDDSVFHLLGDQLEALTLERDMILSTGTYGQRQTASSQLPGALLRSLTLTL